MKINVRLMGWLREYLRSDIETFLTEFIGSLAHRSSQLISGRHFHPSFFRM